MLGVSVLAWQNGSLSSSSGSFVADYVLDNDEVDDFVSATRSISISSFVDATDSPAGSVTVSGLNYSWDTGKLFEETQNLFIDILLSTI